VQTNSKEGIKYKQMADLLTDDVEQKIRGLVGQSFQIDPELLTGNFDLKSLANWDSLQSLNLGLFLEEEF
jgi:acyl carrier protein